MVEAIRGHWESGRVVKAWMFVGPKGTGKTSTARILALAYQCKHQEKFGNPCLACRKARRSFSIHEINASELTGKDQIQDALQGSDFGVLGEGSYRVYILDECQSMSKPSQRLLLKYLEDTPETTVFILCTTEPHMILETVRRRCVIYDLQELQHDNVEVLTERLLKYAKSDKPADRLSTELIDQGVTSPGLIAQAVEKYLAGNSPEDAAKVAGTTTIDTSAMTRALIKGDWEAVSDYLLSADEVHLRDIRASAISYLRAMLLNEKSLGDRTMMIANAITELATLQYAEDTVIAGGIAATLYRVTSLFAGYSK